MNTLMDMESKKIDKVLASNDSAYALLNWTVVAIVLLVPSIAGIPSLVGIPAQAKWGLLVVAIAVSIYIPSYFYFYKVEIVSTGVQVRYLIQHFSHKNIQLPFDSLSQVTFTYYGGKGSAGTGTLKIVYTRDEQVKSLTCSMDRLQAARCYTAMKENGVGFEIKPTWVLNEFLKK